MITAYQSPSGDDVTQMAERLARGHGKYRTEQAGQHDTQGRGPPAAPDARVSSERTPAASQHLASQVRAEWMRGGWPHHQERRRLARRPDASGSAPHEQPLQHSRYLNTCCLFFPLFTDNSGALCSFTPLLFSFHRM